MDVTAGRTIAELDGGKILLEDGPMMGPIGNKAEVVGVGAEVTGNAAELERTGAVLVGNGAELIVTSAELVETTVGMLGTEEKGEATGEDENECELLLEDVGMIENPGKEGLFVKLPDVVDTDGAVRE